MRGNLNVSQGRCDLDPLLVVFLNNATLRELSP
jgi:hypothetical protein